MDFARARDSMVESQVRTADVTDPRILGAMRKLPRERFAPAPLRTLAYADLDLGVAPGRTLLRPRDLAKLIQALAPRADERGLDLPLGVELDKALHQGTRHGGGWRVQNLCVRVCGPCRPADHADADRRVLAPTARGQQAEQQHGKGSACPHARRDSAATTRGHAPRDVWCGRRDSNPHFQRKADFKSAASTGFATSARGRASATGGPPSSTKVGWKRLRR